MNKNKNFILLFVIFLLSYLLHPVGWLFILLSFLFPPFIIFNLIMALVFASSLCNENNDK